MTSFGENIPQNPLKVGVNRQFQAKIANYENRTVSKTVNPIKPKTSLRIKQRPPLALHGWATITLNQTQHG